MAIQYTNAGTNDIPAYMQANSRQLLETVGGRYTPEGQLTKPGLLNRPYMTYDQANSGGRVANQDALQLGAYERAGAGIGAYQPYLDRATTQVGEAGQFNTTLEDQNNIGQDARSALQIGSGTGIDSLSTFQNPYQQDVIDTTMAEIRRQNNIDDQGLDARAAQSGAFGGVRHGVAESEMANNQERNRNEILAKLNQTGFETAVANNENYLGRSIQTGQAMGNLGTNEANVNVDAARLESGIGGLAQSYGINDTNLLATYGDRAQKYNQTARDANVNNFYEQQSIPYQQASYYSDILQGVPSGSSTMAQKTSPNPSAISQGIGAVGTYASVGNQFGWWGGDQ